MEKYYRVSDINEILNKLAKEPYYQHDGEDFYSGVCAVEGELMCLEPVELEEPKVAKWELREVEAFWIQNMDESLETGKPTKAMMPVCSCCKTEFGTAVLTYRYCPNCGAKIIEEPTND
jgi:DNA-directed RNA polymerase subunit RPC12/RpoP